MNEARNDEYIRAEAVPRVTLATLLRIAAEQWPHKSPADQAIERRFMARDLAAFEQTES